MRKDKEYIFKLRKEGKTYRQIQKETKVSRATLSKWFKDISWSKHLSKEHAEKNLGASKERMERIHMVRKLNLQWKYALAEAEAVREYDLFKKEPLFWAGLMIYAGEGDKRSKSLIRISNSEFYIHKIFIQFAKKYLKVADQSFRYAILCYPDLNENACKTAWAKELGADLSLFHKTQVIKGKEQVKRLQYGVGMSIISSTSLKRKLIKLLSLAKNEAFEAAGMVQG